MPTFREWTVAIPFHRYGNKAVLEYRGRPQFAELVILRMFEDAGWDGVWVDTYRRRVWSNVAVPAEVPSEHRALLDRIHLAAGTRSGCFDVFAWKQDAVAFAESKRGGRDRIRKTQLRWIDAALRCGIPLNSLLIVEWRVGAG